MEVNDRAELPDPRRKQPATVSGGGNGYVSVSVRVSSALRPEREDRDGCGRRSDVSLRPFDQRATESIRGNGIDAYPVESIHTFFSLTNNG